MPFTTQAIGWARYPEPPYYRGDNPFNTQQGNEIVWNGVTWTLDDTYTIGQFITGDWWVIDPGTGVTVTSVSPAPNAGVNGSMVNPVSGSSQAFHSSSDAYNSELGVTFPLTLNAGDALLSSVDLQNNVQWDGSTLNSTHMFISEIGVLTVLAEEPPEDAFRPSYVDRNQTMYTVSQIIGANVPSVSTDGINAPSSGIFSTPGEYFARGSQRPWILFVPDFAGRESHPSLQMYNYHQPNGEFLSKLCCYVCTDYEDKTDALHGLIQIGIDMYHCAVSGKSDSSCWVAPIIMAGHFLGDSAMLNCFINGDAGVDRDAQGMPRDYEDFYFYEDRFDDTVSEIVPAGQNYMNAAVDGRYVFFRNNIAPNRGFEHLDPSEWDETASGAVTASTDRGYRIGQDSHQHVGMTVAAGICGLWTEWNHPATQAYIQRWMEVEDFVAEQEMVGSGSTGAATSRSAFVDSMYAAYRVPYVNPL